MNFDNPSTNKTPLLKRKVFMIPVGVALAMFALVSAAWMLGLFQTAVYEITSDATGENFNITVQKYWDGASLDATTQDVDFEDTVTFYNHNPSQNITAMVLLDTLKIDNPDDICVGFDNDVDVSYTFNNQPISNGSLVTLANGTYSDLVARIQEPKYGCSGNVLTTFSLVQPSGEPLV